MFDWFSMAPYEERVVDHFEKDDLIIDTAAVNDGDYPFETGITWPSEYPDSDGWVIVEAYNTREEAQAGHDKWVATMTSPTLPDELRDCSNSKISQVIDALGGERVRSRRLNSTE